MKKTILTLALTSILLASSGCSMFKRELLPDGTPKPVAVQDFTPAIKTAAFAGTYYALKEHPEWREGFQAAAVELAVMEAVDQIDFTTLMAIVYRLPVEELKSEEATVIITSATLLLSAYGGQVIEFEKLQNLKPVAAALREGIELALK